MSTMTLSDHAQVRMQQRGVRSRDLELIFDCAAEVGDGAYFLSRQDAARAIRRRKSEIQALERLCGQKLVVSDNTLETCYRPRKSSQQQMLRRRRG